MSQINLNVNALAFSDAQASNNPLIRNFDLSIKIAGIQVDTPESRSYTLAPGEVLTVYDGTRTMAIDGTTAFNVSFPYPTQNTYRLTAVSGTAPQFRTDRVLAVDDTTELALITSGPIATYIEAYSSAVTVNSLASVPGHVFQFTLNGTPVVYASQPTYMTVNSLASVPGHVFQFTFNGTVISYVSENGDTQANILNGLAAAFAVSAVASVATASVAGVGTSAILTFTAASLSTPFTITSVDSQLTSTPDSYLDVINGLNAAFNLAIAPTVATAVVSGTGAGSTLTITGAVPGTMITISAVDSQLTNTMATTMNTTNVVVGDVLYVGPGSGFSVPNQGYLTVIAKTANSITVKNANAIPQTVTLADPTQFVAMSNGGNTSNQVQIDDTVVISQGFSLASQGSYVITGVNPNWIEFSVGSKGGLPLETGIVPTAAGLIVYSAAKNFVLIAAQDTTAVMFNADTSTNTIVKPSIETCNPDKPGVLLKTGPFYKLTLSNLSLESTTVLVASGE